jgi:heptosyltransferase-2
MAVPAIRALRRRFPAAELSLLGRRAFEPLLGDSDLFQCFLPLVSGHDRGRANAAALRAAEIDLIVLLPHSVRSALEAWRAGVPVRVGYSRAGRRALLTHAIAPHRYRTRIAPVPMHYQYLELAAVLGAAGTPSDGELRVGESARAGAVRWLADRGIGPEERPLALNPGASFGPSKIYPAELFAEAAERARADGWGPLLVLCGPGEEPLAEAVAARIRGPVASAAPEPPPLDLLKGVIQRCRAMITTDAGPRHLATALGVPTVVLMGPTDPRFTAARLEKCAILRRDVPCGPCHRKVCPLDHRCLREIAPREVAEALVGIETSIRGLAGS